MYEEKKLWIATSSDLSKKLFMMPKMANRHGVIAGATGTGKTVTMKVLAESFSDMGVPVFFSDVKGDLSGTCTAGIDNENMQKRISKFCIKNWQYKSFPTRFWDIWGEMGHPVRLTISDMGPVLLSRLLELTDAQAGVLNIAFKLADEHGLLLLDLKDLRAMLQFLGNNRAEFTTIYGNISTASIGAIQRALIALENEGGEIFFGEPDLDIKDFMRTDIDGRGFINILNSTKLINSPKIYAIFLLWLMTELFEKLPEVGDLEKPRIVFFFDEAHLLFDDAPKALLQKIVQVVKLIRSKGVGIYFISQSVSDIPDDVLAQLSNRIQHALRAYTPAEQKALRATANAFRANSTFDTQTVLMELGVGEALVSFLDEKGIPTIVERAFIMPPQSLMGAAETSIVNSKIMSDELDLKYREKIDRESAYEILQKTNIELEEQRKLQEEINAVEKQKEKEAIAAQKEAEKAKASKTKTMQQAATNAASSIARSLTTNMVNSVLGGKKSSASTIAKRAATNALNSVVRSGTKSIIRGFFGNIK